MPPGTFITLDMDFSDITEAIRRLDNFDAIASREFWVAMKRAVEIDEQGWRAEVPVRSGEYKGAINWETISVVSLNAKAVISAKAWSDGGFPYPAALEQSAKFHSGGRPTKGRVQAMANRLMPSIEALFLDALERISKQLVVRPA